MNILPYTDEQRHYSWDLVCKNNYGQRSSGNGNKEQQYTGILAETVLADALGHERPKATGFDNGIDFTCSGKHVDLKTISRKTYTKPFYRNVVFASQLKYETDVYLFASLHKVDRVLEVVGWIRKANISRAHLKPKGSQRKREDGKIVEYYADQYEILCKELVPFDTYTFETELMLWS